MMHDFWHIYWPEHLPPLQIGQMISNPSLWLARYPWHPAVIRAFSRDGQKVYVEYVTDVPKVTIDLGMLEPKPIKPKGKKKGRK